MNERLGVLGSLGGIGAMSPELPQVPTAMEDPQMAALVQQLAVEDPQLLQQLLQGGSAYPQLPSSGGIDPQLVQMLSSPSGTMVQQPPMMGNDMLQRPIDPTTVERVAKALGLHSENAAFPHTGTDVPFDAHSDDDMGLMAYLGRPAYGV